jgi:hypothetical protein
MSAARKPPQKGRYHARINLFPIPSSVQVNGAPILTGGDGCTSSPRTQRFEERGVGPWHFRALQHGAGGAQRGVGSETTSASRTYDRTEKLREATMVKFLLWLILLVLCWPLALLALVLYPIVWLLLLPFRLIGMAVGGVLELLWSLITLPARVLRGGRQR